MKRTAQPLLKMTSCIMHVGILGIAQHVAMQDQQQLLPFTHHAHLRIDQLIHRARAQLHATRHGLLHRLQSPWERLECSLVSEQLREASRELLNQHLPGACSMFLPAKGQQQLLQ